MTSEKILARSSSGWYVWAAASALVVIGDMVLRGVTNLNFFAALLSIVFGVLMFSGKRAEDFVIARYEESPRAVDSTAMPLSTRGAILRLLGKSLWVSWFVLLTASLAFPLAGDLNISRAVTEGMIGLALAAIPLRVFAAAALFR